MTPRQLVLLAVLLLSASLLSTNALARALEFNPTNSTDAPSGFTAQDPRTPQQLAQAADHGEGSPPRLEYKRRDPSRAERRRLRQQRRELRRQRRRELDRLERRRPRAERRELRRERRRDLSESERRRLRQERRQRRIERQRRLDKDRRRRRDERRRDRRRRRPSIYLDFGPYYDPFYDPYYTYPRDFGPRYYRPYYDRPQRITCSYAKQLLRNRGYRRIKATDCRGTVYGFTAWRAGKRYRLRVSARNGAILSRRRY